MPDAAKRHRRLPPPAAFVVLVLPMLPDGASVPAPAAAAPSRAPGVAAAPRGSPAPMTALPSAACLASTLCALKDEVRWRTPAWNQRTCQKVADAVLDAAERHRLSPALLLAVMLNESDLDEKAMISYHRDGALYARDGGLMGIRCVFGEGRQAGRCQNGHVRGMSFRSVMDPVKNVELGARALAYFRDHGGVEKRTLRERRPDGRLTPRTKHVRCRHRDHAWWAHYNHGSFYISRGYARHYPHRVAVLYHGFARALNIPAPELDTGPVTVTDRGQRRRTADRPVESRYRVLYDKIGSVASACTPAITASR